MGLSAAAMARKFDHYITGYGQAVTVYAKGRTIGAHGTPSGDAATPEGATTCLFEFGENAQDAATEAGVQDQQVAIGYFLSTAGDLVQERRWLLDALGQCWLIHGRPNVQTLQNAAVPVGLSALLTRVAEKPAGIP